MHPKASDKLLEGYNCAQAVLQAHCETLGLERNAAFRSACGFGAGIARDGEVCGAVAGAVMAIGLRHGRAEGEGRAKAEACYAKTQEFLSKFRQRHGSTLCRELLDCDLRTAEGQQYFKQKDLLHTVCAKCVDSASELVAEMI